MRATAGPGQFGSSTQLKQHAPAGTQQRIGDRPQTRHGSDERRHPSGNIGQYGQRPITQGMSRRAMAMGQQQLPTGSQQQPLLKYGHQHASNVILQPPGVSHKADQAAYVTRVDHQLKTAAAEHTGVINRRASSRRTINRLERVEVVVDPASSKAGEHGPGSSFVINKKGTAVNQGSLETVNSLPAGFDPIFNSNANAQFNAANESASQIKIKPMRLSKGFDLFKHPPGGNLKVESRQEIGLPSQASQQENNQGFETQDKQQRSGQQSTVLLKDRLDKNRTRQGSKSKLNISNQGSSQASNFLPQTAASTELRQSSASTSQQQIKKKKTKLQQHRDQTQSREMAMESILEEDEHNLGALPSMSQNPLQTSSPAQDHHLKDITDSVKQRDKSVPIDQLDLKRKTHLPIGGPLNTRSHKCKQLSGSNRSASNNAVQIRSSEHHAAMEQLSTMQTSGGFSNTRRSPRDPSTEAHAQAQAQASQIVMASVGQLSNEHGVRFRPQIGALSSHQPQSNSLHSSGLRTIEKGDSFRPSLSGANLTAVGFNNINEEDEFTYHDDKVNAQASPRVFLPHNQEQTDGQVKNRRKQALAHHITSTQHQSSNPHKKVSKDGSGSLSGSQGVDTATLRNKISKIVSPTSAVSTSTQGGAGSRSMPNRQI